MTGIKKRRSLFGIIGIFALALCISTDVSASINSKNDLKKQKIRTMYEHYQQKAFPDVVTVTAEQVLGWQQSEEVVLVDVRALEERAISTIPSAITVEEFQENFDTYAGHKIVYYCTIGYRSGQFAQVLKRKDITIYNLHGGMLGWVHDGGKVYDKSGQSFRIHVYGRPWELAPEDYEEVWP